MAETAYETSLELAGRQGALSWEMRGAGHKHMRVLFPSYPLPIFRVAAKWKSDVDG